MINIATPSVTYMRNRLPAELSHHAHFRKYVASEKAQTPYPCKTKPDIEKGIISVR